MGDAGSTGTGCTAPAASIPPWLTPRSCSPWGRGDGPGASTIAGSAVPWDQPSLHATARAPGAGQGQLVSRDRQRDTSTLRTPTALPSHPARGRGTDHTARQRRVRAGPTVQTLTPVFSSKHQTQAASTQLHTRMLGQ